MKTILIAACLLSSLTSFAQHETDNWFFGNHAALNFSSGQPQPVSGSAISQFEGSASVSDPQTGELLFYTDGVTIWNRDHIVTTNGNALSGSQTSTQSALIVPLPGSSTNYYVFTVAAYGDQAGFRYSVMDMTLSGGMGDVISSTKDTPVLTPVSEKLTAVPHANGTDYWVLVHLWNSDAFYAYPLTANGLGSPVISHSGADHHFSGGTEFNSDAIGCLKPSPDGTMLVSCIYSEFVSREAELFDFNAATGIVSNPLTLILQGANYSASFSPDNSKLYVVSLTYIMHQFDVTGTPQEILDSRHDYMTMVDGNALQLATDGRLYMASVTNAHVNRINFPNLGGDACGLESNVAAVGDGTCSLGFPNFMQYHFNGLKPQLGLSESGLSASLNVFPNPVISGEMIHLSWPGAKETAQVLITDEHGTVVNSREVHLSAETTIDTGSLAAGVYFITVTTGSHSYRTRLVCI